VNLNWTARPVDTTKPTEEKKGGGFLKRIQNAAAGAAGGGQIDLDLAALYELMDGSKGLVQALGNTFTDRHSPPFNPILRLDGDDRSGSNSGGENLFPSEVEELLNHHPKIHEAAVVGVPDAEFGQVLAAFVVKQPRARLSAAQVQAHVREHLARFKVPKTVTFLHELPRNPTGKILKRQLVTSHESH
jgi:acyl-CoA synthetase (AMP-forming)/AMP-acid ligase II